MKPTSFSNLTQFISHIYQSKVIGVTVYINNSKFRKTGTLVL